MARSLRILHIADTHLGAGMPARRGHEYPRRADDVVASYETALARASEYEVDLVLHAGDVFDRPDPCSGALLTAAKPLLEIANAGTPVVVVPGNHERSVLPHSLLWSHPNIHLLIDPARKTLRLRGRTVEVCGWACVRRGAAETFATNLQLAGRADPTADMRILLLHQTFEGSRCGLSGYRFRTGPDVIERNAVPDEFDYVAAGHIHRHQVLTAGPNDDIPLVYAGSTERISFAERDEPKGCVLIEFSSAGKLKHRHIEHAVRPMELRTLDLGGKSRDEIKAEVEAALHSLPEEAIAELRLAGAAARGQLDGLRFTNMARRLRPDVLAAVTTRAVEWRPAGRNGNTMVRGSAFKALDGPRPVERFQVADVGNAPNTAGVYALYDEAGSLLYIGKSRNMRTRLRSHIRGDHKSAYLAGWTARIAAAEVRPAPTELECLLVEADLIRKLSPPYNRQYRGWRDYCYLVDGGPHGQLAVSSTAQQGRCFGPFARRRTAQAIAEAAAEFFGLALCPPPSEGGLFADGVLDGLLCERYHQGLCKGPCADRVAPGIYAALLAQRDALLLGQDDALLARAEKELEQRTTASGIDVAELDDSPAGRWVQVVTTLRSAFRRAALLRAAESHWRRVVFIADADEGRGTYAAISPRGLHLVCKDADDVSTNGDRRAVRRHADAMDRIFALAAANAVPDASPSAPPSVARLPKTAADLGMVLAAELLHHPESATLLNPADGTVKRID